jgi:large subunit ribosomal protein L24
MPHKSEETIDYKARSQYRAHKTKDTEPRVVEDITYEPRLATFEMDVMRALGIEETRRPKRTYWY